MSQQRRLLDQDWRGDVAFVVVLLILFGVTRIFSDPDDVDLRYYEAVVQVIPVLFLALVLEFRLFALHRYSSLRSRARMGAIAAIPLLGEIVGLLALAHADSTPYTWVATQLGLATVIAGLIIGALDGPWDASQRLRD